jgi:hypothetical protein
VATKAQGNVTQKMGAKNKGQRLTLHVSMKFLRPAANVWFHPISSGGYIQEVFSQ